MNRHLLALVAFIVLGLLNSLTWATDPVTYYIRLDGNDANSGLTNTSAGAWRTLAKVNRTTLNAGDTVHLGTGVFGSAQNDTALVVPSSGTAGSPIVFEGEGANNTVISAARQISGWSVGADGHTVTRVKVMPDSTYQIWVKGVQGTRVMTQAALDANNEWRTTADTTLVWLTNPADTSFVERSKAQGIYANGKSYVTIQNMRVTHGTGAITTSGTSSNINVLGGVGVNVTKCIIDSSSSSGVRTSGPLTISYSLFRNNTGVNIYATADSGFSYNNTLIGSTSGIFMSSCKDWTIKNTIFKDQTTTFIRFTTATSYIGSNNLFYASSLVEKWRRSATLFSTLSSWADSTGQEAGSLTGDPLFRSETLGDYHLLRTSPARNTGTTISGLTTDYDGKPIVGTPDMGAFEVQDYYMITPTHQMPRVK